MNQINVYDTMTPRLQTSKREGVTSSSPRRVTFVDFATNEGKDTESKHSPNPDAQEGKFLGNARSTAHASSDFDSDAYTTDVDSMETEDLDNPLPPPPLPARRFQEAKNDDMVRMHNRIKQLEHFIECEKDLRKRQRRKHKALRSQFESVTAINTRNSEEIKELRQTTRNQDPRCFVQLPTDPPGVRLYANGTQLTEQILSDMETNAKAARAEATASFETFEASHAECRRLHQKAELYEREVKEMRELWAGEEKYNQFYRQFVDHSTAEMNQHIHWAETNRNLKLAAEAEHHAKQGLQYFGRGWGQFNNIADN